MIIKTFTAPSLEKALWLLNEDLGPAAVILTTRFCRTDSNPEKPIVYAELIAALDSSLLGKNNISFPPSESDQSLNTSKRIKRNKVSKRISRQYEMPSDAQLVEVVGW